MVSTWFFRVKSVQFSSVTQSCPTLRDPTNRSTPGLPVHHQLLELAQTHVVMSSNHLILCHPLLLLPSIFPSIRVFSSESALRIRWPKFWSFSFSLSPPNEYSGLVSFRTDWFDLLAVPGTLESPLDCKEIQPVHPKGDQSWVFIGRTDVEAETPKLWPPDAKS